MDRVEEVAQRLHELYWDEFLRPRHADEKVVKEGDPVAWPMNECHRSGLMTAIRKLESEGMIVVTDAD